MGRYVNPTATICDVKTFCVRPLLLPPHESSGATTRPDASFVANAETPEEAVLYAMARTGMDALTFLVYDHDLNRHVLPRPAARPEA
jgi:hypothetical protein